LRIIGLTGSIACGKSTVSGWLRQQEGCRIIDGDTLSRELTAPGGAALEPIRSTFGSAVFFSDGTLNRARLGERVFSDFRARAALDALMAPLLEEKTDQALRQAREEGVLLCFLDYPLLFEKGYDALCDTVWCVYLPEPLQLQRLMERDGLSEPDALARIRAVLSSEEKAARSQVVIDNSGSIAFTLSLLPPLLEEERRKAASPRRRRSALSGEAAAAVPEPAAPADGSRRRRRSEMRADAEPDKADNPSADSADSPARPEAFPLASWQRELQAAGSVGAGPGGILFPGSPASVDRKPVPPAPTPRAEAPGVMERPQAARRKPSERTASWRLPAWILHLLVTAVFVLLTGITALSLMNAYLTRQAEQHARDERAVLANYPLEYRALIEEYAAENNLNPAFVTAIIRNESSFQPRAESSVGARGLMQLMPETAEWIARKLKVSGYAFERMWDPESNIRFGCWYLNYLSSLFQGDPVCVACAYHAGQGTVIGWLSDPLISEDGTSLSLNRLSDGPTKTYAGRVIRAYGIYQELYFNGAEPAAESESVPAP